MSSSRRMTRGATRALLNQQVLSGGLLSAIGQYLDPFELVAASSTSKAFLQSFASDIAWCGSTVWLDLETSTTPRDIAYFRKRKALLSRVGTTYNPASLAKVQRLLFGRHGGEEADAFFSRLPVMPALLELTHAPSITVLEQHIAASRFPALRVLGVADHTHHVTDAFLTAVSQLPMLEHFVVSGGLGYGEEELLTALPKLTHLKLALDYIDVNSMPARCTMEMLQTAHSLHSFMLGVNVWVLELVHLKHPTYFSSPPAGSKLQRLSVWLNPSPSEGGFTDSDYDEYEDAQMTPWQGVMLLLTLYPSLLELSLREMYLDEQELASEDYRKVATYCDAHNITVITHPHGGTRVDTSR